MREWNIADRLNSAVIKEKVKDLGGHVQPSIVDKIAVEAEET